MAFSHQGDDVAEHVEAVGDEGHAVGEVADDELDQHEGGGHAQHPQQPGLRSAPGAAECLGKLHPTNEEAGDFPSLKEYVGYQSSENLWGTGSKISLVFAGIW